MYRNTYQQEIPGGPHSTVLWYGTSHKKILYSYYTRTVCLIVVWIGLDSDVTPHWVKIGCSSNLLNCFNMTLGESSCWDLRLILVVSTGRLETRHPPEQDTQETVHTSYDEPPARAIMMHAQSSPSEASSSRGPSSSIASGSASISSSSAARQ